MKLTTRVRQLLRRHSIYHALFWGEDGELSAQGRAVLTDLAKFCNVFKPSVRRLPVTGAVDVHATMVAEGRREVFNRIAQILNLSQSQIYALLESEHGRTES